MSYDAHLDEQHREAMAKGRLEMRERHAKLGMTMQSIAAQGLVELQERVKLKLPLHLTNDEIVRMMDVGGRMERAARGEGTESRYTQINVVYSTKPDDDEEPDALAPDDDEDDDDIVQ
jgi:hypothetical protein